LPFRELSDLYEAKPGQAGEIEQTQSGERREKHIPIQVINIAQLDKRLDQEITASERRKSAPAEWDYGRKEKRTENSCATSIPSICYFDPFGVHTDVTLH